jgi:hypothetical protein
VLGSSVYFSYKDFSELCEYVSSRNFAAELAEASHGLACVVAYRNLFQHELNSRADDDEVLIAKIFLTCRFANSIYASMRLACMGMILDGISCLRTAFEALQYARLIFLEPNFAADFMHAEKSLRPVEVRKRLEALGHDVDLAKKKYSMLSRFSHVGGTGETLTAEGLEDKIAFKIGGYVDADLQKGIILDCHKACGDFIAFSGGIRHEHVERYHATIKGWVSEGLSADEIMQRIFSLIDRMK